MIRSLFDTPNSYSSPKIIAHRGASAFEPENSLPAFEAAGKCGVWAIETDVHKTADGKLVCFHNKRVDGLTDGEGVIADMTFDELRARHITVGNNVAAYTPDELRIPTFEQYLEVCARYGAVPFIELKTNIAEETLFYVRKYGLEDHCVYSAVKFEPLECVRALSDRVFIHHIFSNEERIPRLVELGYSGMSFKIAELDDVPDVLVEHVHAAGVKVCFRAADTPELVRRAIDMGVDYVPSNKVFGLN
ncbi:MAG: hypothetical protein IJY27_03380 [Clostridia bacterium]|nr:hypothetical protein [Clostridia bacterium]